MDAKFASAIDSVLLHALQAIEQLDCSQPINAEELSCELQQRFESGDALLGAESRWRLSKYALVSWIDEMLVNHAWEGSKWWSNNVLEAKIFQSRLCSVRFYEMAQEATTHNDRDALQVFYYCVVLGFRGVYGEKGEVSELTVGPRLPATLEQWMRGVDRQLWYARENYDAFTSQAPQMASISGAPPNIGRFRVVAWALAAAVLFIVNLVVYQA